MENTAQNREITPVKNDWITLDQLQRKLFISRSTAYRWMQRGAIKAYRFKCSKLLYYKESEIDYFLSLNPIAPSGRLDKTAFMTLHGEK